MSRVIANGPGDRCSIPRRVIPKTQKMVVDATLLNTQHYKVRIKGKVEQSREWSSALLYTSVWQLLKRKTSGHPRLRETILLTFIVEMSLICFRCSMFFVCQGIIIGRAFFPMIYGLNAFDYFNMSKQCCCCCCCCCSFSSSSSSSSSWGLQNTQILSLQRGKTTPPTRVLILTLNNLTVRFPSLPVPPWPGVVALYRTLYLNTGVIIIIIIIIFKQRCQHGFHSLSLSLSLSLSPSVPIIHRSRQIFQTASCVCAGLFQVSSC